MSEVTKLNPVDGLPEWKGRKVVTERQKTRAAKRARRFVMVEWGWLTKALCTVDANRVVRLLMVLSLHEKLQRTSRAGGRIELVQHDLAAMRIADSHLSRDIAKLETLGLIEVQRRPGKRPLLRLRVEQ
jgi:hypothetical protein